MSFPLGNPTRRERRQLVIDNARWPRVLTAVPREKWPREVVGVSASAECPRTGMWRSQLFLAQAFDEGQACPGLILFSVQRTAWDEANKRFREGISWDDLQRLKAEAGYGDRWGVEIFPADDSVVDAAAMRHLWLLPAPPPFGWRRE